MSNKRETTEWLWKGKETISPTLSKLSERMDKLEAKFAKLEGKSAQAFNKMDANAQRFGRSHSKMISEAKAEIPGLNRAAALLSNPYVLAAAAVAGLGVVMYKGVQAAEEFNSQFLEIRNLNLSRSKAELQTLNDMILDQSFDLGFDPTQLAKAYSDIQGGTGKYGEEVKKIAGSIGQFAQATKADMDAVTNGVVKAMNAYKFGAESIDAFLESNAKAVGVGIATFDEMAKVQVEFAGSAAGIGQSFDVANKFFAGFTKVSKSVDIAANLTKTAFSGLGDPRVQKGLQSYGIKLFDTQGKMLEATNIVEQLNEKFKSLNDQQFSQFMGKVGGPEGMTELLKMIRSQGDGVINTFKEFDNTKFSVTEALANAKGDLTVMKSILNGQIKTVLVSIGQSVMPYIIKGLNMAVTWLKEMKGNFSGINKEGSALSNILGAVGQILRVILTVGTFWNRIMMAIEMRIIKLASKSEFVKDVAGGIGLAFEKIGDVVDWLIGKIEWLVDNTLGPMLEKIDYVYGLINGKSPATSNMHTDFAAGYLQSKGLDPGAFYQQNIGYQKQLSDLVKAGKVDEAKKLVDSLINKSLVPKEGDGNKTGELGGVGLGDQSKSNESIISGGKGVMNITVNIEKLVENIINNVNSIKEGMNNSTDIITEALVSAVRDSEIILGSNN